MAMTSNDISISNFKRATSSLKGLGIPNITFEAKGLSSEDIERVLKPLNETVIKLTGKDIFDLIEENRI